MEARLIRRPITELLSNRSTPCLLSLNTSSRRHESSYRRTKQRLNVKPADSFLLTKNSPQHDHIIFNPPSSVASVYHTPLKFLPKDDKRRKLLAPSDPTARLPPPVKKFGAPLHHLSEEQIREIQRLRMQDPVKYTTHKLAREYNCSSLFVTQLSNVLEKEVENNRAAWLAEKARKDAVLDAVRERWGPRRRMAREDQLKRQELALRDE